MTDALDLIPCLVNLRTLRLHRRLSQAKLGQLAGLKQDYISELERGMRPSQWEHVQQLARALRVPTRLLFGEPLFSLASDADDQRA
jgi:transcriptional regulator with XRE-family HTH domain